MISNVRFVSVDDVHIDVVIHHSKVDMSRFIEDSQSQQHCSIIVRGGSESLELGGPGSGYRGHAGRPGEVGGAGPGGTSDSEMRALRAKGSYNPATAEKQRLAEANEGKVARVIGGKNLPDNEPFDVLRGEHAVEVKTIVGGKNPKITMHQDSLDRKLSYAKENGLKTATVVIDARGRSPIVYYRQGLGSFRLAYMERVGSLAQLRLKFQ